MNTDHKKIVWLASYPKSGNTWLRIMLENALHHPEEPVNINELSVSAIASSRFLIDDSLGSSSSEMTAAEIQDLRPEVYRQIAYDSEELVFIKVHDAWTLNRKGEPLFPPEVTRAVIYVIRNHLDVVVSYNFHRSSTIDRTIKILNSPDFKMCPDHGRLFTQVEQSIGSWSTHARSWIDQSELPVLVIRYEDMLDNTKETLNKVVEFIGLDLDQHIIEQSVSSSSFSVLSKMEKESGFLEKPRNADSFFRKGQKDDWKNFLDKQAVDTIISNHREYMTRYNYLTANDM